MNSLIFDLLYDRRGLPFDEFNGDKVEEIKQLFNEIKSNLNAEGADMLKNLKRKIEDYHDKSWIEECSYYFNFGIAVGLEVQKFISQIE